MMRFGDYPYAIRSLAIDALAIRGVHVWDQTFDPNGPDVLRACEDAAQGVQAKHQGNTSADAIPGAKAKPLYVPKPQREDYAIVLLHQLHSERYWRLGGYAPEGRAGLTVLGVQREHDALKAQWPEGDWMLREEQPVITATLLARLSRAEAAERAR